MEKLTFEEFEKRARKSLESAGIGESKIMITTRENIESLRIFAIERSIIFHATDVIWREFCRSEIDEATGENKKTIISDGQVKFYDFYTTRDGAEVLASLQN